jgi:putative tryptophan/tyrosine transport system substrate-binding protein
VKQFRNSKFEIRILSLALAILASLVPSCGQQPAKVYRIGWLGTNSGGGETDSHRCPIKGRPNWQAWLAGLREHGYIPGQNLLIDCRWTEGQHERAAALTWEVVRLTPDLIVAHEWEGALTAKQATTTIPIVMAGVVSPEGWLVGTLARPGRNVTGLTYTVGVEIFGKQLQLLKEAVPKASRVAILSYLSSPSYTAKRERDAAAQALRMTLEPYVVQAPEELASTFAAMTTARAEALLGESQSFFSAHRQRIVDLAAEHRLPGMYYHRDLVEAGGLMSYAADEPAIYRRLAYYVDKIFKGAKPGDLPMEQPTKFELLINLKTAKALGLTIPESLLRLATEVIE